MIGAEEMRSKAYAICRDYLHGAWQLISPEDMILKPISGGLSNLLFFCELPKRQPPVGEEPSRVLLRMYGQVRDGAHESTITESVIFTLLAERRLGPKLYGIFPGGRLEEFIQAQPLSCNDLREPQLSQQIAQKMAMVHSLKVPISKEPTFLWQTMKKWIQLSHSCLDDAALASNANQVDIIKALRLCNFEQEMEWLKQYVNRRPSPVLFCHNDCQEGNILRHNSGAGNGPPRLTLIDFEYCSYNYRGFDVANHFCEWQYDYSLKEYPYFVHRPEQWPDRKQQLRFIQSYLETTAEIGSTEGASGSREQEEETKMLEEVPVYSLASHLFWALWSIVNAPVSTIPFGYWEYGLRRVKDYQKQKQWLLESDPKHPKVPQGVKRRAAELD